MSPAEIDAMLPEAHAQAAPVLSVVPDEPEWLRESARAEDATEPAPYLPGSREAHRTAPEGRRNIAHPGVAAVTARPGVVVVDFADFVATAGQEDEEEWLVAGLVPANGLTILGGDPKTGKTLFALDLGFAVASGGSFLERETGRASFLYVTEEGSPAEMRKRAKRLITSRQPTLPARLAYRQGVRFDDARTWEEVRAATADLPKPALVALDPLRELILGDENDSATINAVGRAIRGILADFEGVTVLLLHHLSKRRDGVAKGGHRLRGSSALWGAADCTLLFVATGTDDEADADGEVPLRGKVFVEPRNAGKATVGWSWDKASGMFVASESEGGPLADRVYDYLLLHGPTTTNRLAEALDASPGTVRTTITRPAHRDRFRVLTGDTPANRVEIVDATAGAQEDRSQVWDAVLPDDEPL